MNKEFFLYKCITAATSDLNTFSVMNANEGKILLLYRTGEEYYITKQIAELFNTREVLVAMALNGQIFLPEPNGPK